MPEDPRRARIFKGKFMTSDPVPPGYVAKRQPLAPEHEHFAEASRMADNAKSFAERQAEAIAELTRRFLAVKAELDALKPGKKK